MKINEFIDFLKLSIQFQQTKRAIYAVGENRKENDAEHSYQVALSVWYLIENQKLKLDSNLAIKYALIHDLEEAFNGDVHIFNTEGRKDKEKKEEEAMKKIAKMFPSWTEYKRLSKNYRNLVDEESRLVNGIEKILPVLNIYFDKGRVWHEEGTSLKMITDNKREKVKVHPLAIEIWKEVELIITKNKQKLFRK